MRYIREWWSRSFRWRRMRLLSILRKSFWRRAIICVSWHLIRRGLLRSILSHSSEMEWYTYSFLLISLIENPDSRQVLHSPPRITQCRNARRPIRSNHNRVNAPRQWRQNQTRLREKPNSLQAHSRLSSGSSSIKCRLCFCWMWRCCGKWWNC